MATMVQYLQVTATSCTHTRENYLYQLAESCNLCCFIDPSVLVQPAGRSEVRFGCKTAGCDSVSCWRTFQEGKKKHEDSEALLSDSSCSHRHQHTHNLSSHVSMAAAASYTSSSGWWEFHFHQNLFRRGVSIQQYKIHRRKDDSDIIRPS